MSKPILCLDFDGVVHACRSGWRGPTTILDDPVPGALEFIRRATERFEVHIYCSRSGQPGGVSAMIQWLWRHAGVPEHEHGPQWLREVRFPRSKPLAFLALDARALQFTGTWPDLEELARFKPWYMRRG